MAEFDIGQTSRTNLKGTLGEYAPNPQTPDRADYTDEFTYHFTNHAKYTAQYKTNPFLKKAIDGLANWITGRGIQADRRTKVILNERRGYGEDTFLSIVRNFIVQKKVQGDAFIEIIRNEDGRLVNLKPLYAGDMKIIYNSQGMIKRYEQHIGGQPPRKFNIN